jgi:hypothetical protein
MNRRRLAASLLILSAFAVSGCAEFFRPAPAALSENEIEGTWSAVEPARGQSTVTFADDGTITIDSAVEAIAPSSPDPAAVNWDRRLVGTGTWVIADTRHGTPQRVDFTIDDPTSGPQVQAQFWVQGDVGAREIYEVLGGDDSEELFVFEKQE